MEMQEEYGGSGMSRNYLIGMKESKLHKLEETKKFIKELKRIVFGE